MYNTLDRKRYIGLLADIVPTVISNEEDYRRIESKAEQLSTLGEDMSVEEVAVLQLLLSLMQHYEDTYLRKLTSEDNSTPPHLVLKELMLIRGLKQKDMTGFFGGYKSNTSAVLSGKRAISKEQAKALAEYFNVSPAVFI